MELLLQVGLLSAMVAYLVQRRVDLHQRNLESGESLLARFETTAGDPMTGDPASWLDEIREAQETRQDGSRNLRGLLSLYRQAGLMMRLADRAEPAYAQDAAVDPVLLMTVRRNAMQARISALTGMARWALQG